MSSLFEVKNLSCGYGRKEILKNITFAVRKGEVLGLIGPNGSGKTTLLRALTKILSPWQGSVVFQGEDLKKISVKQYAQRVAVIPQRMELPFNLNVEEFVTLGRFAHLGRFDPLRQNDREIVRQTLELTELIDLKDQDINEISGGELQRVILAQGFVQRPQVLILDEPTTHLDITHQIRILNLLKKMNRESNLTIIMSIHDLNLAGEYCDSLILLNQGRIFKEGDPHTVITYKNIEEVYKTLVVVKENPISGKPYVVLVSNR